ncbi:alpha-amylase, partial [Streptomyces sp. SID89]|nr:alpha-amylase [Streptomyces sp. SID89]
MFRSSHRAGPRTRRRRLAVRRRGLAAVGTLVAGAVVPIAVIQGGATARAAGNGSDVTANLFMWNWQSVASECTGVLGPKGYGSVLVSPPQDSIRLSGAHPWWEVYQPVGYDLNSRMGTEAQFKSMVAACHSAGVKVYADAVINHMSGGDQ